MAPTLHLRISILRAVNLDDQPGFVEGQLIDAHGHDWRFIDKIPVISLVDIDERTSFPQPGVIACRVLRRSRDDRGREILTVTTDPWGIESTEGRVELDVFAEQLDEG